MAQTDYDTTWRVPPEVQRQRDEGALALKMEELAADPGNPALQRDVAFTQAQLQGGRYGPPVGLSGVDPSLVQLQSGGAGVTPSVPSAPRQPMQAPTTSPRIQALEQQRDAYGTRLNERLDVLGTQADSAAQGVADVASQPMPERKQLQTLPQYHAQPYSKEDALNFGAIATAFAALAGLRTRQPLTSALIAAGSAMKGYTEGRFAQVRQDLDVYRTQFNAALTANRQMLDEYQSIINDRNTSRAEKVALWQVASTRWKDEATAGMLRLGQFDRAIQNAYTLLNSQTKLEEQSERFTSNLEQRQREMESRVMIAEAGRLAAEGRADAAGWSILQGQDGKTYRVNARTGKITPIATPGGTALVPPGKGQQGRPAPVKAVEDISGRVTIVGMLDDLITRQKAAIAKGQGFGGYVFDMVGDAFIKGGRALGENTPEALFFSELETIAQPDRHELFGATLTGGEKDSWRRGWAGAGDSPQTLLSVMEQKRELYKKMAQTKWQSYTNMRFNMGNPPFAQAPAGGQPPSGGGLSPEREQRYQELLRKRNATQ